MDTITGPERPEPIAPAEAGPHADAQAAQEHDEGPLTAVEAPTLTAKRLGASIEALVFTVDRPLPAARIAEAVGLVDDAEAAQAADAGTGPGLGKKRRRESPTERVHAAIKALNEQYAATGRAFRIEPLAAGYRVMTLPEFAPVLEAFHGKRERRTLSRAAIETLAIIAYKQPITRATLEAIRGVACGEILHSLMERRLIEIAGRAEELGRPILYGTSRSFLEAFGLSSIKDLPTPEQMRARLGEPGNAEGEHE